MVGNVGAAVSVHVGVVVAFWMGGVVAGGVQLGG